uniref:Uncharacterized protein n=1 Tax=Callorhinchus milii TaxID=7868 RepID=A0A4W3JNA1_CALMI
MGGGWGWVGVGLGAWWSEVDETGLMTEKNNVLFVVISQLISSDADGAIQRAGRFRVENGSSDENTDYTPGTWRRTDVHLENPEYHTR